MSRRAPTTPAACLSISDKPARTDSCRRHRSRCRLRRAKSTAVENFQGRRGRELLPMLNGVGDSCSSIFFSRIHGACIPLTKFSEACFRLVETTIFASYFETQTHPLELSSRILQFLNKLVPGVMHCGTCLRTLFRGSCE